MAAKKKPIKGASDVPAWKRDQHAYLHGRSYIDGVDHLAHELEDKWGVGRLRLLVDPELRARFDAARARFNHTIWHGDLEEVKAESAKMTRAWQALDRKATELGAEPLSPVVWEVALPNGTVAVLCQRSADSRAVQAQGRKCEVYTLDEIGHLLAGYPELVKAKIALPGAEVVRVGPITDPLQDRDFDDEIPFGGEIEP